MVKIEIHSNFPKIDQALKTKKQPSRASIDLNIKE